MSVRILLIAALLAGLGAGCQTPPAVRRALAKNYKPANVYLRQPDLPQSIHRVALLPLHRPGTNPDLTAAADWLAPLLFAELGKRNLAELVPVPPDQLRLFTGSSDWAAEDKLPLDFFKRLTQANGCDAVLFASVTAFQPYPPLRVGWKARLVDCKNAYTWWAVDEVFDAGAESVAAAAEAYARSDLNLPNPLLEDVGVLHSPRRFGQYTAHAVAATLPRR